LESATLKPEKIKPEPKKSGRNSQIKTHEVVKETPKTSIDPKN
jgi:hypothetical protein